MYPPWEENRGFWRESYVGVRRKGCPMFCACRIRFPVPLPPVAEGWMLTGNATRAAEELSPPPPPPEVLTLAAAALDCGVWPNGNSPMRLENIGGKLEKMFGVARERTGVVRDSVVVVVVEEVTPPKEPPPAGCAARLA